MKSSKRYNKVVELKQEIGTDFSIESFVDAVIKYKTMSLKFNESIDLCINTNVNAKKKDQNIKFSTVIPFSNGQKTTLFAFVEEGDIESAKSFGADYAGSTELMDEVIAKGVKLTHCITTPSLVAKISKYAKHLGPRGIFPSPKLGTVANDIESLIKKVKSGMVDIKSDKFGSIKLSIGRINSENLKEEIAGNINHIYKEIKAEISNLTAKTAILSSYLSTTGGLSGKISLQSIAGK